jgi:hypothetical protein
VPVALDVRGREPKSDPTTLPRRAAGGRSIISIELTSPIAIPLIPSDTAIAEGFKEAVSSARLGVVLDGVAAVFLLLAAFRRPFDPRLVSLCACSRPRTINDELSYKSRFLNSIETRGEIDTHDRSGKV